MRHEDSLIITDSTTLSNLTSVNHLEVCDGATLTVPQLTSVSYLEVLKGATLTAPQLTSVDRMYVYERATLMVPRLTSANRLNVREDSTLTAPQLISVGYLRVYGGATLTAPLLTSAYGQRGREIARCPQDGYVLWLGDNGLYYAGCRRELTRDAALAHWRRRYPQRAKLFTAAILNT